ncbi:MAG: hypothetical protein RI897_3263 [Verrucomicrobiota bacterium]
MGIAGEFIEPGAAVAGDDGADHAFIAGDIEDLGFAVAGGDGFERLDGFRFGDGGEADLAAPAVDIGGGSADITGEVTDGDIDCLVT